MLEVFWRKWEEGPVEAGVYLNLHPAHEAVVREAVLQFALDDLVMLGLVASTVGDAAVKALCLGLHERAQTETTKSAKDRLLLMLEVVLRQNDRVAADVFDTLAAA